MKKYLSLLVIASLFFTTQCSKKQEKTTVSVQPAAETVNTVDGENLDLQLVGELYMKSQNAEAFEKELNKEGGINNLDLDGNGEVDWITVTEVDSGDPNLRMASLSVNFSETDIEEVATIEIEKNASGGGEVYLSGSESVYGSDAHYRSSMSVSDAILLSYLFAPTYRPYYSPYYYYSPPVYYRPYRPVPMTTYRTTTRTVKRTSGTTSSFSKNTTQRQSKVKSPNAGKTSQKATQVRQTKSTTKSQKAFTKASDTQKKQVKSDTKAFGKKDPKKTNATSTTKKTTTPKKTNTSVKPKKKSTAPSRVRTSKPRKKH
jgi:hypothetical protein